MYWCLTSALKEAEGSSSQLNSAALHCTACCTVLCNLLHWTGTSAAVWETTPILVFATVVAVLPLLGLNREWKHWIWLKSESETDGLGAIWTLSAAEWEPHKCGGKIVAVYTPGDPIVVLKFFSKEPQLP